MNGDTGNDMENSPEEHLDVVFSDFGSRQGTEMMTMTQESIEIQNMELGNVHGNWNMVAGRSVHRWLPLQILQVDLDH